MVGLLVIGLVACVFVLFCVSLFEFGIGLVMAWFGRLVDVLLLFLCCFMVVCLWSTVLLSNGLGCVLRAVWVGFCVVMVSFVMLFVDLLWGWLFICVRWLVGRWF